ncbi:winged helix-turn-helix domain-containing protein [[Enterobacter] lignolyticus]|uniref:Transcriptional regulator, CadC n=1 Tax=Enterobacter lignolyticus (strain SCF1) TaxID=701347 RepID=E3GCT8_ENTLS|nr:winged helix-turn-helix domain-containing protein [[Enterobacter] lignolyticus]ADO47868.1 transcriptional regulator, CadC [[Enterobacter] lignolyticus SCF1]
MAKIFLLEGIVAFWHERNVLYVISDETKRLSLSNPASRCLLLLLQHHGQVIERDYFFQQVWTNNGAQVTNNTFYQNISLLRRAFKELGLNEDLIVTVPRVGIRLEASLQVQELDVEPVATEVDAKPERERTMPLPAPSRGMTTVWWVLTAMLSCLFASVVTWRLEFDTRLTRYVPLADAHGCHWFANQDVIHFNKHQQFIKENALECENYPWVYLTVYPNFPRISALTCREQYTRWGNNECVTHYYIRGPRDAAI